MVRKARNAGPAAQVISAGGPVHKTLMNMDRDRADAARTVGLDPSTAMLLPLMISLARLAAQQDAKEMVR